MRIYLRKKKPKNLNEEMFIEECLDSMEKPLKKFSPPLKKYIPLGEAKTNNSYDLLKNHEIPLKKIINNFLRYFLFFNLCVDIYNIKIRSTYQIQ